MTLPTTTPALEPKSSDLRKLIEQRICQEFPRGIHNFRIEVLDGGLVLEGRTKSYYTKSQN